MTDHHGSTIPAQRHSRGELKLIAQLAPVGGDFPRTNQALPTAGWVPSEGYTTREAS